MIATKRGPRNGGPAPRVLPHAASSHPDTTTRSPVCGSTRSTWAPVGLATTMEPSASRAIPSGLVKLGPTPRRLDDVTMRFPVARSTRTSSKLVKFGTTTSPTDGGGGSGSAGNSVAVSWYSLAAANESIPT